MLVETRIYLKDGSQPVEEQKYNKYCSISLMILPYKAKQQHENSDYQPMKTANSD